MVGVANIGVGAVALTLLVITLTALGVVSVRRPFLALAALALVTPFGSTITVPAPPPLANVSSLVGAFAVASFAGNLLLSDRPRVKPGPLPAVWTLLLSWAALTTLWSVSPFATATGVGVLTSLVLLHVLVAMSPVEPQDLRTFETGLVLSGVIVSLYAVYLAQAGALTGAVDQRFVAAIGGSEVDSVADPNITAASLLLPFFVAVAIVSRSIRLRWRILAAGSAALTFIAIFLTGSRGGLLALLAGLVVMVWASPHRAKMVAALLLPALGMTVGAFLAPASVTERVSQDFRSSGRTDIWRIGLSTCPQNCLVGSGWATFPDVHEARLLEDPAAKGLQQRFEAHSIWVGKLVTGGIVGLGLIVTGLLLTWRQSGATPATLRGPPRAGFIGAVLGGSLIDTFSFKYFWLVLIYVMVVHNLNRQNPALIPRRLEGRSGPHELALPRIQS